MDNRKNRSDRRHKEAATWDSVMEQVASQQRVISNVAVHMAELRATVNHWASMSTCNPKGE